MKYLYDPLGRVWKVLKLERRSPSSQSGDSDKLWRYQWMFTVDYNERGEAEWHNQVIGVGQIRLQIRRNRRKYDDLGRTVETIENYAHGVLDPEHPSFDFITRQQYSPDGDLKEFWVNNVDTDPQVTKFKYGVSRADGSQIARSDLLREIEYPDGRSAAFTYTKQGEVRTLTDQNGTRHTYLYDYLGRLGLDTAIQTGINIQTGSIRPNYDVASHVRSIQYRYDSYSRLTHATSFGDGGLKLNEVRRKYNHLGLITSERQLHHADAKGIGPTYVYSDDKPAKENRLLLLKYPSNLHLQYDYTSLRKETRYQQQMLVKFLEQLEDDFGEELLAKIQKLLTGGEYWWPRDQRRAEFDQAVGRVGAIRPDMVRYQYFGERAPYGVELMKTLDEDVLVGKGDAVNQTLEKRGAPLGSLDKLDHRNDMIWKYGATKHSLDVFEYQYSPHGIRRYRGQKMPGGSDKWSEQYTHGWRDRLYRLRRGKLNESGKIERGSETFLQSWELDATGNAFACYQNDTGKPKSPRQFWHIQQRRTHNKMNQIRAIDAIAGPPWIVPQYDHVGNTVVIPQPNDPAQSYFCDYDAWNRLVAVWEPLSAGRVRIVAEYDYDALGRRIVKRTYDSSENPKEIRHFYYSPDWHVLEERVVPQEKLTRYAQLPENELLVDNRYCWGVQGIDDLVVRIDGAGRSLNVVHDANNNVTSVCENDTVIAERFHYDAYGKPYFLDKDFNVLPDNESQIDWTHLYGGYVYDVETGLYHVRRRMLHPTLGVWLTPDPKGYAAGPNLYQYARSSPINFIDRTGEEPITTAIVIGSLIVAALGTGAVYYANYERNQALEAGRTWHGGINYDKVDWDRYNRAQWVGAAGEIAAWTGIAGALGGIAPSALGMAWSFSPAVGGTLSALGTAYGAYGAYQMGAEALDLIQNWDELGALERFHRAGMLIGPTVAGAVAGGLRVGARFRAGAFRGGRYRIRMGQYLGERLGVRMLNRIGKRVSSLIEHDTRILAEGLSERELMAAAQADWAGKRNWFRSFIGTAGERIAAARMTQFERWVLRHAGASRPGTGIPDFIGRGPLRGWRADLKIDSANAIIRFGERGYRFHTNLILWRYPRNLPNQ